MENYEQKYKELKFLVKNLYPTMSDYQKEKVEGIFPELAESDDEKIRKDIISYIKSSAAVTNKDWIAWLEKQGKQNKWKPSKDEMDALYGLVYVTNEMDDRKDVAITKLYQDLKREFFKGASFENMFPSIPIDSDINIEKQGEQKAVEYSLEQAAEIFLDSLAKTPYNNKPVTDAQVITKELLKFLSDTNSYNPNAINEQKPTWSEEDEQMLERVIESMIDYQADAINNDHKEVEKLVGEEINWLKSLKPQHRWKPTKEQMKALEGVLGYLWETKNPDVKNYGFLLELHKDLKNL